MTDSVRNLIALAGCSVAVQVTATAVDSSVPPWTVVVGLAVAVVAFLIGRRMSQTRSALIVLVATAVTAVPLGLALPSAWVMAPLFLAICVLLPWLVGRSARQHADLAVLTTERVHLVERARLAHEMHDTLGHDLSLVALRAGALELAQDLPERHREAAGAIRSAASQATRRLAHIVTVLREAEPPPLVPVHEDIEALVARAVDAGMRVAVEWTGASLPSSTNQTAHRIVQEALTNAAKHAPGAAVRVRVTNTGAESTITITNGRTRTRSAPGTGTGLTALRERVRLAGGTMTVQDDGRTFGLVATLPHTGEL
ncbi:sensor histidine kinase [Allokutzneria oryzae]|uniref:histidine kinase n=1 Tax=Allokutzneria oryzae TaxID=1378989 RepID=A0ABV6A1C4_9PSEU